MSFQKTLKRPIELQGVGLHSGIAARVVLQPARPNRGISFVRADLPGRPEISAHYKNVVNTQLCTVLGRGPVTVGTVEHVLAALQGMGVDNAQVEVYGKEVPILDGSALPFANAIEEAGLATQALQRAYLAIRRQVELRLGEKWAVAEPSVRFEIQGSIEWDHPAIGYQEFHYIEGRTPFSELAGARTFGLLRDVEAMRRMGLAKGGSLDNAVVLDDSAVVNPGGLRFPDEMVRHKVLDALGDFKLAGLPIQGYFRLHRAGHDLHGRLLQEIFRRPDCFEIVDPSTEIGLPLAVRARVAAT